VITEGARGARLRLASGRWQRVGVFPADLIDAAGAGDWTTAGMIDKIMGSPRPPTTAVVKDAVAYGHALAALNCALPGARGLAEGRNRSSIDKMANDLRRGQRVVPTSDTPAPAQQREGVCTWCLLDLAARASAGAATS
jgi:hypothetical protein